LAEDPFTPALDTHKLKGVLEGLWACSAAYDCRIVFEFVQSPDRQEEVILLVDIGTHDQVY
jgi:mRNA-degrading endonuclease YafQ of YafQ-DinJ toxin-antitoxin module